MMTVTINAWLYYSMAIVFCATIVKWFVKLIDFIEEGK